ncbi:unnamed protein product [Ascophyllum nodosum]
MPPSGTEIFRPCRRVLTPGFSGAGCARPQGLKKIPPVPQLNPRPTGLRVNVVAAGRSGYDVPHPGLVLQSRQVVRDDSGRPARYRVSGQLTLEKAFGEKKRVKNLRERRGGIPANGNPGDKPYRHVAHSTGFHEVGELIVGSSFFRTNSRRGDHSPNGAPDAVVPEGLGYALGHRKPKMDFQEMRKASQYLDDIRGVLGLTVNPDYCTEATQSQLLILPATHERGRSWEEKTGMHTWPKDKKGSLLAVGTKQE